MSLSRVESRAPGPQEQGQAWPLLRYEDWKDTCATLHMWSQIVGKIRLACSPWINHSWHATLYVTARGPAGMMLGLLLLGAAILSACAPSPEPGEPSPRYADRSAEEVLLLGRELNWQLSVRTAEELIEGRVARLGPEAVQIGDQSVAYEEIREIVQWTPRAAAGQKNAVIAGAVGGGGLGFLASALCGLDSPATTRCVLSVTGLMAGIGAALGFAAGGVLWQPAPAEWVVIWTAPSAAPES